MGNRQIEKNDLLSVPQRDCVGELALQFARSAAYGALQGPLDGIAQLLDKSAGTKFLPAVHIMDHPAEEKFGTAKWHAQQIGAACGMAIPLLLVHRSVSGCSRTIAEQEAKSSSFSTLLRNEVRDAATTGALYGGILTPCIDKSDSGSGSAVPCTAKSDSFPGKESDFAGERLKSALAGAITFASFAAGSRSIQAVSSNFAPLLSDKTSSKVMSSMLAGIPAGLVSAQTDSTLHGRGNASPQELMKSAYSFAVVGGSLTIGHSLLSKSPKDAGQERFVNSDNDKNRNWYDLAVEDPLSKRAQHLLDLHKKALADLNDFSDKNNRQNGADSSKKVRLADIWLEDLPEDSFNVAGKDRTRYWKHLARKFESRSIWNDISPRKQAETYAQIERLLRPADEPAWTSTIKPMRLRQLARETLENVSNPYGIDQGDHPTCVLNSIENVIASNHPEKYARLIADLGLTGESYKNGIGIKLPERCMVPDMEAKELVRKDNSRCYASQLCQYYLANLHWSEGGELPNGEFADSGSVIYQPLNAGRNRAGLYVDGKLLKNIGKRLDKEGSFYVPLEAPEISDNYIAPLFRKVVPRGQIKVIDHIGGIEKFTDDSGKRTVTTIATPKELEQALLTSKRGSVIAGVRSEQLGGDNGWHAVVIRDFDVDSGTVSLDNSWGRAAEHSGRKDQRARLTIKDLFKLMEPPEDDGA